MTEMVNCNSHPTYIQQKCLDKTSEGKLKEKPGLDKIKFALEL